MGKDFWWFLDAIVLATFFVSIFTNAKNGFIKSVLALGLTLLAAVVAFPLSSTVSESIYDDYFKEKNTKSVKNLLSDYNIKQEISEYINLKYGVEVSEPQISEAINDTSSENVEEKICDLVNTAKGYTIVSEDDISTGLANNFNTNITTQLDESLPSWAVSNVGNLVTDDIDLLTDTAKTLINSDSDASAEFIEENYIKKLYTDIISIVAFSIIFTLITIIGNILFAVFGVNKLESTGGLNTFAGGALGFAEAFIGVYIFSLIVKAIIIISSNNMVFFNEETVKNSILFRLFYNLDIIA